METKIIFIFLLVIGTVTASYAGEIKGVIHIENCVNVTVEVLAELEINDTEYSLIDCVNNSNKWFCECNGDYTLYLKTSQNTLNNYTFIIYYWEYVEGNNPSGGGSSSRSRKQVFTTCNDDYVCGEWSECVNTFKRRECKAQKGCGVDFMEYLKCSKTPVITPIPTPQPTQEQDIITDVVNQVDDVMQDVQTKIEQEVKDKSNWPIFAGVIVSLVIVILILIAVSRYQKKQYEE